VGLETDQDGQRIGTGGGVDDIAADGSHVADLGATDAAAGLDQHGCAVLKQGTFGDLGVGYGRPNADQVLAVDGRELWDVRDVHHAIAEGLAFAELVHQVGAAGQDAAAHVWLAWQCYCLLETVGSYISKLAHLIPP
jgi:hypothetical protein